MKIKEAVNRIKSTSKSINAWEHEGYIHISWNTFTILVVPYEAKTMFDCHFINTSLKLPADLKVQLSGIIGKLLRTPIRERFPEKKYYLRWIDEKADKTFLGIHGKTKGASNTFWVTFPEHCPDAIFTESELNQLKKDNPRLALAIDAMKEPLGNKDEN